MKNVCFIMNEKHNLFKNKNLIKTIFIKKEKNIEIYVNSSIKLYEETHYFVHYVH
jgi:hypothetical protein